MLHVVRFLGFYPREAMLARHMLSSRVRPSVCLSVRHKPVRCQNGYEISMRSPTTKKPNASGVVQITFCDRSESRRLRRLTA